MNRIASGPVVLLILDGWGHAPPSLGNAIDLATTPQLDRLRSTYPSTILQASGEAVGLMKGQMGDSNVGHLNLGAGRVVYQDVVRIDQALLTGDFQSNAVLQQAITGAAQEGTALHLLGLLSDGGVHSHEDHLYALLTMAKQAKAKTVWVHAFLDGRDVPPCSALLYVRRLETVLEELQLGQVATVTGRYYAMDRDGRWLRTERAYAAMVEGKGKKAASAEAAVQTAYVDGDNDEFVKPTVIGEYDGISPGDHAIFFNFRADRARQLSKALVMPDFDEFRRTRDLVPVALVGMTVYQEELPMPSAFGRLMLTDTFGEVISRAGYRQLRVAETEKYAHVTFFFSGMQETVFPGECRMLIPSPKVTTYDQKPEMSAYEVTTALLEELSAGRFGIFIVNLANLDMVAHTGCLPETRRAVEVVDDCAGRIAQAVHKLEGQMIIVGDHGNAEQLLDDAGQPYTAHTENDVPCVLVSEAYLGCQLRQGVLGDVAPTLLEIMGVDKPAAMTCRSLIQRSSEERDA